MFFNFKIFRRRVRVCKAWGYEYVTTSKQYPDWNNKFIYWVPFFSTMTLTVAKALRKICSADTKQKLMFQLPHEVQSTRLQDLGLNPQARSEKVKRSMSKTSKGQTGK